MASKKVIMSGTPFFSIIIPTYNRAPLISTAIESILAQEFEDWELIIVDDGSTDNTKQLLQSYTDVRIKYIYQKNAERCAARNNGITHSMGRYICFLDSDDYFTPLRLQHLYERISREDVNFYYTGMINETPRGRNIILSTPDSAYNIYENILLLNIHSQQTCIHRKIFDTYRFDPAFRIGEDMELWFRMAERFEPTYLPDCADVVIVDHDDRTIKEKTKNIYIEQLFTLNSIFKASTTKNKVSNAVQSGIISYCYFNIAKYNFHKKKTPAGIFYLLKSIMRNPKDVQTKYKLNILFNSIFNPEKVL